MHDLDCFFLVSRLLPVVSSQVLGAYGGIFTHCNISCFFFKTPLSITRTLIYCENYFHNVLFHRVKAMFTLACLHVCNIGFDIPCA